MQTEINELRGQALYDQGIVHAFRKPVGLDIRRINVHGAYSLWLKTGPEKETMCFTEEKT